MDQSLRLLTSMSPVIAPNAKRRRLRNRGPRKLALKSNVRKSSLLDGLPATLQNTSLVIVNSSVEDIETPILAARIGPRIVQSTTDFSNLLSVTRYAEIRDWITEVNSANETFSDEECSKIIRNYVTERRKRTDLQIESDLLQFNISGVQSDDYCVNNFKNTDNLDKDRTCIVISSSSGSSETYKSACSDVVIIESSFTYVDTENAVDETHFTQSERLKKKPVVRFKELPKTEGKTVPRNQQADTPLSWFERLKRLCDSDTTNSSARVDIFNSSKATVVTSTVDQQKLKNGIILPEEPTKKQIRKKLNFNEILETLTNKEGGNNISNNIDLVNRKHNKINNNGYYISSKIKDRLDKEKHLKKSEANLDNKRTLDNFCGNDLFHNNPLKVVNGNFTKIKLKQTFNKNKENEILSDKCDKGFKNTYREKTISDLSSDDESLESRLRRKTVPKQKFQGQELHDSYSDNESLQIHSRKLVSDQDLNGCEFNNDCNEDKYFSDASSDYEALEDKLRKKNVNFDTIFKTNGKTNVPRGKNVIESKIPIEVSKKPTWKPKNNTRSTKVANGDAGVKLRTSVRLNEETHKSFLESLSGCVKVSQCHPSARIFRNSFQTYKKQLTTKLFKMYNRDIFDNAISDDSPIEWSDRMRGTAGYCYCRKIVRSTGAVEKKIRIVLSSKVLDSADRLRDTLVHELCHAATWIVNGVANGHGDHWKAWTIKARKVFPELPPINRCHDYVINTKYTYRCINCGYSFGRHSKSLDLNSKRCGYCLSKFELLINKKSKDGEVKSVPVTPKREPTGFALFVKENYGIVKTPQLNHGQVMKLLGQQFTELKV